MKLLLSDLNDFVIDLNGVVEDQLISFGFDRSVAKEMVSQWTPYWKTVMEDNLK